MSRKNRSRGNRRSWPGPRMLAAGLLLAAVFVAGAANAIASDLPEVVVRDSCPGGQEGTARDPGGTVVTFRVCPLGATGLESEIRTGEGTLLSRVARGEDGTVSIEVAGIRLGGAEPDERQVERMEAALTSAEARLAGRLPVLLVDSGWPEDALLVRGLAAHGPLYEDRSPETDEGLDPMGLGCTSPATGCKGCCGPGCWGCTGICTPECYAHDECAEAWGRFSPKCTRLLELAITSMLDCLGCPEECRSGPFDCCGGEGPACVSIP